MGKKTRDIPIQAIIGECSEADKKNGMQNDKCHFCFFANLPTKNIQTFMTGHFPMPNAAQIPETPMPNASVWIRERYCHETRTKAGQNQ